MTRCAHGFDVDAVVEASRSASTDPMSQAVIDHARDCAECARVVRAWSTVVADWRADMQRDEQFRRAASEVRLAVPKLERAGVPWVGALALALVGIAVGLWVGRGAGEASGRAAENTAGSMVTTPSVSSPVATTPRAAPVAPEPRGNEAPSDPAAVVPGSRARQGKSALVAVRACAACGAGIRAGATIGDAVEVPPEATLRLNWAISSAVVEAAAGVDVRGPALVRSVEEEDGVALRIERGVASVTTTERHVILTANARTSGADAEWTVRVDGGRTRVTVRRGDVDVHVDDEHRIVAAGQAIEATPDGRLVVVVAAAPRAPVEARPAADRATGPTPPTPPLDTAPSAADDALRDRASFALAEADLARGEIPDAQRRLLDLLHTSDPSLAGDAVFLLARSTKSAKERAAVLARYEETAPPSPYREQAEVERGWALLAAGDVLQARSVATTLRAERELPSVVAAPLAGLERALQATPASAPGSK